MSKKYAEEILTSAFKISRLLRNGSARPEKLGAHHWFVLALIKKGHATTGAIAGALNIAPSSVSAIVDRLNEDGMVERSHSAGDRRVSELKLTAKGRRALEQAKARRVEKVTEILGMLDEKD